MLPALLHRLAAVAAAAAAGANRGLSTSVAEASEGRGSTAAGSSSGSSGGSGSSSDAPGGDAPEQPAASSSGELTLAESLDSVLGRPGAGASWLSEHPELAGRATPATVGSFAQALAAVGAPPAAAAALARANPLYLVELDGARFAEIVAAERRSPGSSGAGPAVEAQAHEEQWRSIWRPAAARAFPHIVQQELGLLGAELQAEAPAAEPDVPEASDVEPEPAAEEGADSAREGARDESELEAPAGLMGDVEATIIAGSRQEGPPAR